MAIPPERQPHPAPLEGLFAPNTLLRQHAQRLFEGQVLGSESVAVDERDGTLWMLDRRGHLWSATPDVKAKTGTAGDGSGSSSSSYHLSLQPAAYVGPGRPLGFHEDSQGNLIICDSLKGLTLLERKENGTDGSGGGSSSSSWGRLVVLANRASPKSLLRPGSLINYANDLDIASDGTIYFTDSTDIPVVPNWHASEGGWCGRGGRAQEARCRHWGKGQQLAQLIKALPTGWQLAGAQDAVGAMDVVLCALGR